MKPTTAVPTIEDKTKPGYALGGGRRAASFFAFGNMSSIYLFVVIFIVFAITIPDRFLRPQMWLALLDNQAIGFLAAIAVLIPMVAGQINLAIAGQIGFSAMLTAVLLGPLGLPVALQFPLVILIGGVVGLVTGLIITYARIDSIIATLGVNSLLVGMIQWISGGGLRVRYADNQPDYKLLSQWDFVGITLPVWVALVVAVIAWYVLERSPIGRRMYAVGFNPDGAKLSGVNTRGLIIGSLVAGGLVAGLAGALLQSRYVDGDPTIGGSYLLPALTAVFLGSTQFRGGRFNVWGTMVALFVLAVGIKGIQLMGAEPYVDNFFNGAALLIAVGIAAFPRTGRRWEGIRRVLPWSRRKAMSRQP
ncbi:MAG: ABC transporter permease [Microbacteriaceae bacterium]|nr:ABC transporter permease [Microbacteriaceae bacterium]